MSAPRPADDTTLHHRLWDVLDERVHEDGDAGEPATRSRDEQAVDRELIALIDETCSLWRRLDDDTLSREELERARGRCNDAARSNDEHRDLCAFLHDVCALVEEVRSSTPEPASDGSWGGLFDWTVDVPLRPAAADVEHLERTSDACWALYTSACLLGLENWKGELGDAFLALSRDVFVAAGHQQRWELAAAHRGRHYAVHTGLQRALSFAEPLREERFMLHNPNPILDGIGCELALVHSRQQELLGASITISPAAVAFDMTVHCRPAADDAVAEFFDGYSECTAARLAAIAETVDPASLLSHRRPADHLEVGRPAVYDRSHLDLALCTWSLRNESDIERVLEQRLNALVSTGNGSDPAGAEAAVVLACEAAGVAPQICTAAHMHFLQTVADLFAGGRFEDVVEAVEAVWPYLDGLLDEPQAGFVEGLRLLSLSRLDATSDVTLVVDGCAALATSDQPGYLGYCATLLWPALAHEAFVDHRDELVALLIRCQLRRARQERDLEPIAELVQQLDTLADAETLPARGLVDAARAAAAAVLRSRFGAKPDELVAAGAAATAHPELADLEELLVAVAPNPKPEAEAARAWVGAGISAATHDALLAEDWAAAAHYARADLGTLSLGPEPDLKRVLLLGILARALRGTADTTGDPAVIAAAADETRGLVDTAGDALLGFADSQLNGDGERLWVLCAGDVGLAAVALHRRTPGPAFPVKALRLLERAAELAGRDADPLELAGCLHDLGHAYHSYAAELSGGEALGFLERAAALFREVLVLYAELRRQPGGAVALRDRSAHVDYLNLASVHLEIAAALNHDPGLIEEVPHAGALSLRAALWTLSLGRDIAQESGDLLDAAHTRVQLAGLKVQLALACLEHTRANKGAFRRDFQLYLAVIEQVPASTWDFASRYALSALHDIDAALTWFADERDVRGLTWALQHAFLLLGVAQLRHGVSGAPILLDDNLWNMQGMRRTTLVVLQAAFERLLADESWQSDQLRSELAGWSRYLAAQMRLESFEARGSHLGDLTAAAADFERLEARADPIVRAFVRPYADWFSVSRTTELVAVNGLALAPTPQGLEITLAAQGRSFVIGGLKPTETFVLLRESSWIKTNSTGAIASRLPQFDWSVAPPVLPVLAGACELGATWSKFLVARLPASSWDVWVMHLAVPDGATLDLTLPFGLRGIFRVGENVERVGDDGPLRVGGVAVMDAVGLTLEVSAIRGPDGDDPAAQLLADGAVTRLRVRGEIRIALRATPATVDAGVALLVRADSAFAGACAAATSPVVAPALGIPSSLMRAYSPLFLFEDAVDPRLQRRMRDSSNRQTIVVGAPPSDAAMDELLASIVDPRREIVFLVKPEEVPHVVAARERLTAELDSLCASSIYSVGGSTDLPRADSPQMQVIEVGRMFAPAAAQLALDLIAFRTAPVEDIPTGYGTLPYEFQILGDPTAMRESLATLPNPASWDELVERHGALSRELPVELVGERSGGLEALLQPLARRPALVVPEQPALLLACTPYARHLGALLLPDNPQSWELIRILEPPRVLVVGDTAPEASRSAVERLPADPRAVAVRFAAAARKDHEASVGALRDANTSGAVDELLLRRMEPSAYAVIASGSDSEREAAALAANYAAALGSPLLLFDDERVFSPDTQAQAGRVLSGAIRGDLPRDVQRVAVDRFRLDHVVLPELEEALDAIAPTYVGFVSTRMTIPVELAGQPPLATRYAVGRLTAPDAASLSSLITAAALREEVLRDPRPSVVVVEAADAIEGRYLPGAKAEAEHVAAMLANEARFAVTPIAGPHDRDRFLSTSDDAAILHFCGHGRYSQEAAADTGLVFRQGLLHAGDVPSFGRAAPIVYANACESGAAAGAEGVGRAWSGLAAAFIDAGALNYLGSLWPIMDTGSRELAERFYALLIDGYSVGEALRQAKLHAYSRGDPTWAAVVLFGCPRNRLRSGELDAA